LDVLKADDDDDDDDDDHARKCEAVACLSSQMKCYFYELLYCVLYGEEI